MYVLRIVLAVNHPSRVPILILPWYANSQKHCCWYCCYRYAFMEFDSVANGKRIVDYFNSQEPFEVDGKLLLVDSAKNTYRTM